MADTEKPNYLDPRVLERIKRLDVRARLVVEGFVTGQHKSPYNGFAVEFASHREYSPGDEINHNDWKVWSKTDKFYIKEYEEETNLKTTIIVDCSKSMGYGREHWSKFDYAATAGASLGHLLQGQGDAVGMITFNTGVKDVMPPSARLNHLKEIVHVLDETVPDDKTDVSDAFMELIPQIKSRGLVVIISDLFADIDTWVQNDVLLRNDKIYMNEGVEVRVPFLDQEMIENFLFYSSYKKINFLKRTKPLLRKLFKDQLKTTLKIKKGFDSPFNYWINNKKNIDKIKYFFSKEYHKSDLSDYDKINLLLNNKYKNSFYLLGT